MDNLRAKTSLAVEIAQVHRDRFNEAVAAGHYECAPRTLRGTTRLFEVEDVVALWVYGRLTEDGVPPSVAGSIVCKLLSHVLKNDVVSQPVETVIEVKTRHSRVFFAPEHFKETDTHYGGEPYVYRRFWPIARIRREVIDRLEWERNNLGSDD